MTERSTPEGSDHVALIARLRQLERASRPLEPGSGRRKDLRNKVVASSERFLRSLANAKAFVETADNGRPLLDVPFGESGIPIDDAIELFEKHVVRPGAHPASPRHMAYIPGSGLYLGALGDFLAAVTNKYASIFFSSPGAVRMENMVVRWTAGLIGYPSSAAGSIASGGSIANLTAIVTARDAHSLKGAQFASTTIYLTTQAHHCIEKALRIAGLGEVQVRYVPVDGQFRMRADALAEMIATDRRNGLVPWMIVGTAGTTDTGAVDPLDAIADAAERERCWFHCDAAYGGYFMLTEDGRRRLQGIERSDSAVLDPHKGLFLPWGSGIVVVKDAAALARAHAYSGNYMQDALRDPDEVNPADISPELSKHFRGLRMWLPLILLGTGPFAAALEEKLLLARYFAEEVRSLGFTVLHEPELSIVTFRWEPEGISLEELNALNHRIIDGTHRDGRVFLSSTMLDGKFTLRMVALSFRTHRREVDLAIRVLREQLAAIGG